jgi:UDP-N-acetylmuramate: L-alanyl-gamma-D-glutamyl-meso-diaminopimelate ligase
MQQLKHVHIIGVCGTLMGAFAAYLKRCGLDVTGSDQNVYPPMSDVLEKAGVRLFNGYSAENLSRLGSRPDLIVIGNVIPAVNPEARAAIDGGYTYSSLPEAMENLMLRESRNLVVAGTHGKTTTSCMLAHVLAKAGKAPSYFIGGVSQDLPFSFQVTEAGPNPLFVLEGDEYDTAFWDKVPKFNHYLPNDVILTSVEFDHADIYADLPAVVRAFDGLMTRIRPEGRLIACWDYSTVRELAKKTTVPVISYGISRESGARF